MEKPRSIKKRNDYIPAHAQAPAVLYEGGYLSTPSKAQVLMSDYYRDEAADRLAQSIDLFFRNAVSVTEVNVIPKEVNMMTGSETQFKAVNIPTVKENDGFIFISENPNVASVDETGKVTAKGEGTTTRTVRPNNNSVEHVVGIIVYNNPGINVDYSVHTLNGWENGNNGILAGSDDFGFPIYGFKASLKDASGNPIDPASLSLTYQYFNEENGWSDPINAGKVAGAENIETPIEAVKFNLAGSDASNYQIYYCTFIEDFN